MDLQVKKLRVDISTTPRQKLSPRSLSSPPRQRQITHSLKLRGWIMKTYFKMYCFNSTFLKNETEECGFC